MHFEIMEEWDDLLSFFSDEQYDIYFSKRYVGLYEGSNRRALCVECREKDNIMLMPFLRGTIDGYYDFETAYGYGGPIANTNDLKWCARAFQGIHNFLKDHSYVCGFTRFHPLLNNEKLISGNIQLNNSLISLDGNMKILYDRPTIAINTALNYDDIWTNQISSKNRNMIRKAEKNGLIYKTEYDFESYDEFIDLYDSTMQRLDADDFYFFDREYYNNFKIALKGNSFLSTVRKGGKLICSAIFIYSKCFGHYHLEGSDRDYSSLGANNLLLWKAACEMHDLGIREFHLGGGTSSSLNDPLFRFKKVFSRNEKTFHIGKEVFDNYEYEKICNEWYKRNPDKIAMYGNRLLKYKY